MRTLLILIFVTFFSTSSFAQGLGYLEGGLAGVSGFVGRWSDSFHVGGGGEVIAADHVGIGGEIGFFNRLVVGSANATLYPARASARVSPFVTAGYSRFGIGDGEGGFNAVNVGAGAHIWFGGHAGLRLEVRDHFRPDVRGTTQYWSARAGISFR